MCSICEKYGSGSLATTGTNDLAVHFAAKLGDAFPQDGVGDIRAVDILPATLITTDTVADSPSGASPTLVVGAAHTISTLDTIGDQDFYQVHLVAGQTYEIGMYGYAGGPNAVPLLDAYVELYGADGTTLIVSGDGGADTPANALNSGFDVLLTFEAQTTGTYYINAKAFDNTPEDGTNGEGVGDYELFVQVAPPESYRPYYDVDSPLYAIDWGSQVNRVNESSRNPDGNEGTRATGNAPAAGPVSGEAFGHAGKNVITIYFAKAGDVFTPNDPTNPGLPPVLISAGTQAWEKEVVFTALHEFEKVADVIYVEVATREEADFFFTTYAGTPGPGVSLLGSMSPPDESDEGLAQFNSGDYRWTQANLQQGGFSYVTLIHEFGHGHGLAHPHDNGGRSGIMRGVESEGVVADYTTGDFNLNQGIYTMMSYEDGWQTSPYGNAATDAGYGYLGGLMAFDIAAIQDKYGVNEEWATGNDTYTLKDVNAAGTFFSSIWDGGGTDQIVYSGGRSATIDLRPATLRYEEGGGGRMSYAYGIFGGFTIANGVTIENATSGAGNDVLIGNGVANVLSAGLGNDHLEGGSGADTLIGGGGNDSYVLADADTIVELAGGGIDSVEASITYTLAAEVENLTLTGAGAINGTGNGLANQITGNAAANALSGNAGNDWLDGGAGADMLYGGDGNDTFVYDHLSDRAYDNSGAGGGIDTVRSSVTATLTTYVENLTLTGSANATGVGNALNNVLTGNSGNNLLNGGAGADTMYGGDGNDIFVYDHLSDRAYDNSGVAGGIDTVQSSVTASLTTYVENLTLTGTAAITGVGNALSNTIVGNSANNIINGAAGADTLSGGGGNDTYLYLDAAHSTSSARDRINGFDLGDKIDLSKIDANSGTPANDAFTFIGASAFTGAAGQLRAYQSGLDWFVEGDVNGDGVADLLIALTTGGGHSMIAGDFVL
jgi:Ca2+-binding RTX toxin-like protein